MTTIEDKLRKIDFEEKAPEPKPTLKGTIYDFHSDPIKNFEKARAKYLDDDYNYKSKTFSFTESKAHLLEDTGFTPLKMDPMNDDPISRFFGLKTEQVPNRFLDGYYEFDMAGKDNKFYMKDMLLREGGNMTDLEARLQAKEEFMELWRIEEEAEAKINESVSTRVAREEAESKEERRASDQDFGQFELDEDEDIEETLERMITPQRGRAQAESKSIQVEKAIRRRKEIEKEEREALKPDTKRRIEAVKKQGELQKLESKEDAQALYDEIEAFKNLDPARRTPALRKKMNTLFKIIDKHSQPGKVKLITTLMDDKQIKSVITNNIKIMKTMDAKAKEREEAGKRAKELTAEEKAREAEEKETKATISAEMQRLKGVFAKKSTGAKPAEEGAGAGAGGGGISEAKGEAPPPQEVVEAKAEAKEAVQTAETAKQAETTDPESLWGDADATLQQLQPAMTALTEELQFIDKSEKVSEETKNKMNRLMVIVDS